MGDRKSSFSFRFWSSATPATRRQPANQTTAPPLTTTSSSPTSTPKSRSVNRSSTSTKNPTSTTPRKVENKTPGNKSTSSTTNPTSTTPPTADDKTLVSQSTTAANSLPNTTTPVKKEGLIADNKKTKVSTEAETSKPTATNSTSPTKEPHTSSPPYASSQSPSSSQPVTPTRRTTPQPSSLSSATPQARSAPSSPSRVASQTPSTPQRTSQSRSSYRTVSHNEMHTSSTNPSKESRRTAKEIAKSSEVPTLIANEKNPKSLASQQEPDGAKNDGSGDYNDRTIDGISSKHNEDEVMPSKSSQLGRATTQNKDSSTSHGGHEPKLSANSEETKDVKEVVQATNTEANEEARKEVNDLSTPKPGFEAQITEKARNPSTPEMHTIKQGTKEILPTSVPSIKPTNTTSQPKKRSTIQNNYNKSALPIEEHVTSHKDVKDDISAFVNRMSIGDLKSAIYNKPVSVITLAGENRGASMEMGSNSSKTGLVHIHRSYKINPEESVEATTDREGSSKGKRLEDAKTTKDQPTEAYVNNNAQGINNSIVLNSSVIERNPGVHMVVTHVPKEPIQSTDKTDFGETRKSELNMTRLDKLTYEPTVRRRCLRGLLLETSDSDPENLEKPRRHGCRVGCQQTDK